MTRKPFTTSLSNALATGGFIMQSISSCCKTTPTTIPAVVSDDPFSQILVLDYCDGEIGGFLKCRVCDSEYNLFMLDWDDAHLVRIVALAPIADGSFQRLFTIFNARPDQRRVWTPPVWSRASEERLEELYESGIQDVIDHAATPTIVIAWSIKTERTLAMRKVDPSAVPPLVSWFDQQPPPSHFDWFGYLRLPRSS